MPDVLPAERRTNWLAGTYTGVIGGIPTDRTNQINVKSSPYFAAGNITETIGTITSGSPDLSVVSASGFSVGNYVKVGLPSIQTVTVTAGCSGTGFVRVNYKSSSYALVSVTNGDTTTQVATKIRSGTFPGWSTGGSGNDVIFTQSDVLTGFTISTSSDPSANTGVTTSVAVDQSAVIACTANRIDAISGTDVTLHDNASASVTSGIVSHNDKPSIQEAINASSANDVIYFPSGSYRIDSAVDLSAGIDNVTIRGDGPDQTIIYARARGFAFGASDGWSWPSPAAQVSSGLSKDSTSIVLDDASAFTVGAIIKISFGDMTSDAEIQAGAAPTFGVGGWDPNNPLKSQVTRISAKASNTLTIFPGIYCDPDPITGSRVWVAQLQHDRVGIEDMWIDMTNSQTSSAIQINHGNQCWVKNVKITNFNNYGIEIADSYLCQIEHCDVLTRKIVVGSNGAAILHNTSSGTLMVNNICYNCAPGLEVNAGSSGHVFAYNLVENPPDIVYGIVSFGIDTNHGPHNSLSIYEGNIAPSILSDGYFGSESECSAIRNWLTGTWEDGTVTTFTCSPHRFARNFTFAKNTLGTTGVSAGAFDYGYPNIGNASFTGEAEPSTGDFWDDWKATATLTTRASNTAGTITLNSGTIVTGQLATIRWGGGSNYQTFTAGTVSGADVPWTGGSGTSLPDEDTAVQVFMQPSGYQELDLDVENSSIEKGNAVYTTNGASYDISSLGGDTVEDSYIYASKPIWFGELTWPYDPTSNPNGLSYEDTPAGYRFINGEDPPSSGSTAFDGSGSTTFTGAGSVTFG